MNAGLYASVLARTPSKLVKMLLAQEGITQAMIDAQLTIVQGEVADVSAVKRVLLVPTRKQDTSTAREKEAEEEVEVVSQIISRIGGVAQLHWSLTQSVTIEGLEDIGKGRGWQRLRVGSEEAPALGYTVRRADVGQWIFEEVVKMGGERWFGQKVALTN
ncbi:hypothetical protein BGX29_000361 [Mortierella sp. GBA35]|nr:hypothetical protein BGX29_000361 [Mortierella sp. GBA35]